MDEFFKFSTLDHDTLIVKNHNDDFDLTMKYDKLISNCLKYKKIAKKSHEELKSVKLKKGVFFDALNEANELNNIFRKQYCSQVDKNKSLEEQLNVSLN